MTSDANTRIARLKTLNKTQESLLLRIITRVGRITIFVKSSDIADADGAMIHPLLHAMGPGLVLFATFLNTAVDRNDIMVTDTSESTLFMPKVYVGGMERHTVFSGGAMNYDGVDFPFHCANGFREAR